MSMILSVQNQPKSVSNQFHPSRVNEITTLNQLHLTLRKSGCSGCPLGQQNNFYGPVVYRGLLSSKKIIIGEAPGLNEDKTGIPFCGPAGKKMDELFREQGMNTNDWIITNCVLCRPVAPAGSGRQNLTPTDEHHQACRPYLNHILNMIQPRIALLLGKTAICSVLRLPKNSTKVGECAGKIHTTREFPNILFYSMYHPAALLHSSNSANNKQILEATVKHIQEIKTITEELNGT